jgi:hypothetical protein
MVQEGECVCLGQLISHLYHSLQFPGIVRWGMLRTMTSVMVLGSRPHCIWLGGEGWVEAQAAIIVQGWIHPFRYDNIENHLCNQHYGQWALH